MKLLHRLLGTEPSSRSRVRLREAFAARDAAQVELENAQQHVERVQSVIEDWRSAKRRAFNARAEAVEAMNVWAAAGADLEASSHHEHLATIANLAEVEAEKAQATATAAGNALGAVRARAEYCASAISTAEMEINEYNAQALIEEQFAEKIEVAEGLARALEEARLDLMAFRRAIHSMRRGWRDHDRSHDAPAAAKTIDAALTRCYARDPVDRVLRDGVPQGPGPDPALSERTEFWRAQLRLSRNV